MAKSNIARQKNRGRPATGVTPTMTIRLPNALIAAIDRLSSERGVTRSEIVRVLIEDGLPKGEPIKPRAAQPKKAAKR